MPTVCLAQSPEENVSLIKGNAPRCAQCLQCRMETAGGLRKWPVERRGLSSSLARQQFWLNGSREKRQEAVVWMGRGGALEM